MKKVTKGNVTIKLWDLGGQPRFRSMWERYCRAVSAIVYGTISRSRLTNSFLNLLVYSIPGSSLKNGFKCIPRIPNTLTYTIC